MILVDSNVLIDVVELDSHWEPWSSEQIEITGRDVRLVINEIILAEVAPRSGPLAQFEASLDIMGISIEPLTVDAAYRGGSVFQDYCKRRNRDTARSILADFLIGGHAATLGATILTRDPRVYRTYFPTVPLITPTSPAP